MPTNKDNDKNKPYVENYPPLWDWLKKHDARCNWQLPHGSPEAPRAFVECWAFQDHEGRTQQAIVLVQANQLGWEIFTPNDSADIAETLGDAERRLGLG